MSIEGCPHGPSYITGGPERCPDCAENEKFAALGREHAKQLAAPLVQALKESNQRTDDRIAELEGELEQLRASLTNAERWIEDVREREAACCPEDVGFDEYIQQLRAERDALQAEVQVLRRISDDSAALREALEKISKGEGRFSNDNFQFACNTIDDMKAIAVAALAAAGKEKGE